MYDIMVSKMFFKWISKYGSHITGWTDSIAEIDALASFGTYVFNNPDNTYGEILAASSGTIIETSDIVHPFLSGRNGVPNNFTLKRDNLAIVTGANMAGKSTFLRTIGVSFILATNGAAVCARKFCLCPGILVFKYAYCGQSFQRHIIFPGRALKAKTDAGICQVTHLHPGHT